MVPGDVVRLSNYLAIRVPEPEARWRPALDTGGSAASVPV